ncbi:MAG: oxygen-independent coproporphyrinogen III oxidase [Alphaproteobacteria bacterium]
MTPELLAKYSAQVPRYTSYPTAPHFGAAVDRGRYRAWLGALAADEPLSLYLHVPFCNKLCWYCGCHTTIVNAYPPVAAYADLLVREIELVADALGSRHAVSHVHWGGGTPTIMSGEDFLAVTGCLRRRFDFSRETEIAVEIDPRGLEWETVEALAGAGVTRASLGVQDFHHNVMARVNRVQSYAVTARAVGLLRHAGIADINFDLMYGLPLQTAESLVETVDAALELEPARIALFGYAHVPWMKRHQRLIDESELPGAVERWRMAAAAAARLCERGYIAIGLDHFARPDNDLARALTERRLRRNFQGYTTDCADTLLGFGASAIASLPQGYAQNETRIPGYRKAISGGFLATTRGVPLSGEDRLRRDIIERLMCYLAVDLEEVCREHGETRARFAAEIETLKSLSEDGLVRVAGARIRVTEEGRPLVRSVCAAFDTYLGGGEARHAAAV